MNIGTVFGIIFYCWLIYLAIGAAFITFAWLHDRSIRRYDDALKLDRRPVWIRRVEVMHGLINAIVAWPWVAHGMYEDMRLQANDKRTGGRHS